MLAVVLAAGWVAELGNWLNRVSGEPWFLALIVAIAIADSVVPVVPSETCVIIGGVAAGSGKQSVVAVIACATVGAFIGDNIAYQVGRAASHWVEGRRERKPKFAKRLDWASDQIAKRGGPLLVTARFIPGGRTALTLSCGITRQRRGWFAGWIALAALVWGTYATLLGYLGGRAFEDNHTAAFVLAFAGALAVTGVVELVRRFREKRHGGDDAGRGGDARRDAAGDDRTSERDGAGRPSVDRAD